MTGDRILGYPAALLEGTSQEMARDESVILFGLGVDDARGLGGTTKGLQEKYGKERVFDTPLSEDGMTGIAVGAALAGLRPIHTHVRMDFLMLAMNQLVNIAAKARYMSGGKIHVPMVVRALIGDGWGAQHCQGLHSFFAHIPGLKIVAPATPYHAKGCLAQAIRDDNPVIVMEHFRLYGETGPVPEKSYTVPFGKADTVRRGKDVTLVGISFLRQECVLAAEALAETGIDAEVIDPVSLSPLDIDTIAESAARTGHLVVADSAWTMCGVSAEIVSAVAERSSRGSIKFARVGFAPVPSPNTHVLADLFYPNGGVIAEAAHKLLRGEPAPWARGRFEAKRKEQLL